MRYDFPWLGFIFWFGLFAWFGIASWVRFLREQERQKTLRAFAERGTPLDQAMMEKFFPAASLQAHWQPSPLGTAGGLMVAGIVVLCAGVGLLIGAQLIAHIAQEALYGMSAGGIIAACVGLGLIISSWALRRMHEQNQQRATDAGDPAR